jgi:hypothetical protein
VKRVQFIDKLLSEQGITKNTSANVNVLLIITFDGIFQPDCFISSLIAYFRIFLVESPNSIVENDKFIKYYT